MEHLDYLDYGTDKVLVIDDCELFQRAAIGLLLRRGFTGGNTFFAVKANRALLLANHHQEQVNV